MKKRMMIAILMVFPYYKLHSGNVDFTYNVDVDTTLQAVQVFSTTITNTAVKLYGMVINKKYTGPSKVAT